MRRLFHDANNMVASLLGNLSMMRDDAVTLAAQAPSPQAGRLIAEMQEMIADNLDCLARLQAILAEIRSVVPSPTDPS